MRRQTFICLLICYSYGYFLFAVNAYQTYKLLTILSTLRKEMYADTPQKQEEAPETYISSAFYGRSVVIEFREQTRFLAAHIPTGCVLLEMDSPTS